MKRNLHKPQIVADATRFQSAFIREICGLRMRPGQQLIFENCNLSVNHSIQVQLTAARKSKVLHCVCKCIGIRGVGKRSHKHEQRAAD